MQDLIYEKVAVPVMGRRGKIGALAPRLFAVLSELPDDKAAKFRVDSKDEALALASTCRTGKKYRGFIKLEGDQWFVYAWRRTSPGQSTRM